MKKEASGKKGKVLWLVLGIVLLLAVVGVVLALVLGGQDDGLGGRPELYWNIDRGDNIDRTTGLSIREPAEDGNFYIRFAYDGEQIEIPVADKKLVNYIDGQDLMYLVLDKSGYAVDVLPPQAVASVIGESLYVQNVEGDTLIANSSIAMNGRKVTIKLDAETDVYNVSGKGEFVGEPIDVNELNVMDTISVYGTLVPEESEEDSVVTHIFVTSKPVESPVYWRADQFYDSTNKVTTREPDENGAYTMTFFVDGETVELKSKNKELVSEIDSANAHWCHYGLEFDEDGYFIDNPDSFLASRTLLQCERFDITEIYEDGSYVATSLIKNNGATVQGVIGADCKIYDVSNTARSEKQVNRKVDTVQLGDRVCIWTDTTGKPVLIYVTNRIAESPAYWVVTRSYNSTEKKTSRVPNAQGMYEIELLRVGDNKNTTYYTDDVELASAVDLPSDRCVGLKLGEGNVIECVYDSESLFGNSYLCRGYYVLDVTGSVGTYLSNAGSGYSVNGVLASGCKVINVSTVGEYGAEVLLRFGDSVYAYRAPGGEIAHAFVAQRYMGTETMYFHVARKYNSTTKETTRTPDADGYYVYEMAHMGKLKTLKTKDKKIADMVDAVSGIGLCLEVKGDIIKAVHADTYASGGGRNNGWFIKEIKKDKVVMYTTSGKEETINIADGCEYYNVSTSIVDHFGEKTTLKVGDYVVAYRDVYYNYCLFYIRGRESNKIAWPVAPQYDTTAAATMRTPDANGWYYVDLAVDGKVSTYKTKNKNVINAIDSYTSAFGIRVSGNEITYTSTYSYVKDVYGAGVSNYTVSSVKGNQINTIYTLGHATLTGSKQTLTLNSGAKIYDVSDPTSPDFGKATKVKEGDVIRSYTFRDDRTLTQYVFITAHCTRAGGYMSYCDHCDKVVYWNPYVNSANVVNYDTHYYLANDIDVTAQMRVYSLDRTYETVLDLNGHTMTRNGGRLVFVRYGSTVTIMDSVGGGMLKSINNTSYGGVLSVGADQYGIGTLNLLGGTVTMASDESVTGYSIKGGLATSSGIFNMYGGELIGGYVKGNTSSGSSAGGVLVSGGQFNMYGGKISGGVANGGTYEKVVKDPDGNPVIDETTGLEKKDVLNATGYGGNLVVDGVGAEFNLYDGVIENGRAARGGNIAVTRGTFTMYGGTITNGEATADLGTTTDGRGGNFFKSNAGNIYIKGGTVSSGKALSGSGMGGNFMLTGFEATLHVSDNAVITNGEAKDGNNVALMYSNLNVTGGSILNGSVTTGNSIATSGTSSGGYSTVTMSGGTVDGVVNLAGSTTTDTTAKFTDYRAVMNISGGKVEAINVVKSQGITVSGNPVIKNVKLGTGMLLNVGKMVDGADVTVDTIGVFSKPAENAADYTGYFHSTSTEYLTGTTADNELKFYHPNTQALYCPHCGGEADWMPWDGTTVLSGHYYLTENVQLADSHLFVDSAVDVAYDLRGHTITAAADNRVFYIKKQGELTIVDTSAGETGVITGGRAPRGGNIYVETDGVFNMYSGTVTNGVADAALGVAGDGRGGNMFSNGIVNLYGGTFSNGVATTGSGNGGNIMLSGSTGVFGKDVVVTGGEAIQGNNVMLMYGHLVTSATITNGSVTTGDSIFTHATAGGGPSSLVVDGGKIDGSIYLAGGTSDTVDYRTVVAINGGELATINVTKAYGDKMVISGAPVIDKLKLAEGVLVDATGMITGASVNMDASGVFTTAFETEDAAKAAKDFFHIASPTYEVKVTAENQLSVGAKVYETTTQKFFCEKCDTQVEFTSWYGTPITESGHYYLAESITLNNQIDIAAGVEATIELNGFSITAAEGKRTFNVTGTLNLQDSSSAQTGKLIGSTVVNIHGGNICVNKGTFNMYSGTVTGGTVEGDYYGGNIVVMGTNGNANIYGGIISNGSACRGGNIYVSSTVVNISGDAQILGGTAPTISATTGRAGNIYVTGTTAYLTVSENAIIADGNAALEGGNIFSMYGNVEFKDNVQVKDGVAGNSGANMTISGTSNPSTLVISGGTFTGGEILLAGGGNGATVATISGGTFNAQINAISIANLTVSGAPVINDLKLKTGEVVTVGALTSGATIKINATSGVFTDVIANANTMVDYFDAVEDGYKAVVTTDNKLEIVDDASSGGTTPPATTTCPHCTGATWQPWDGATLAAGHYYLTENVKVTKELQVKAVDMVIDLRGFDITGDGAKSVLGVYENGILSICDTVGGGVISGANNTSSSGGNIYVWKATFNLYSGTIADGFAKQRGGNIYCTSATVNIYGGTVSNGTVETGEGGNIYVVNGNLTVSGDAVISDNSVENGNAIYVASSSTPSSFVMTGGTVNGEAYLTKTETVELSGKTVIEKLTMVNNTVITKAEAFVSGASVKVNASEGVVSAALTDANAALPYMDTIALDKKLVVNTSGALEVVEACPCGCKVLASEVQWKTPAEAFTPNGSWKYEIMQDVHVRLDDNLDVDTFFARSNGGTTQVMVGNNDGATVVSVTLDLNGKSWSSISRMLVSTKCALTIVDTSVEQTGKMICNGDSGSGGVFYVGGTLNLRSGTLTQAATSQGNYAKGGVVYISSGVFNMYGGQVLNGRANSTSGEGGNVHVFSGAFNMYGGKISGGAAAKGADVFVNEKMALNVYGGNIAGEVYVPSAKATVMVSGTANIGNLNLLTDSLVTVGDLVTGARIAVTKNGAFTDALDDAESVKDFFTSAENGKIVDVTADKKLTLVADNSCSCGCGAEADQVNWVAPENYFVASGSWAFKILENVHLRLDENFDVDAFFGKVTQVMVGDDSGNPAVTVTIDLNGNTWSSVSRLYVGVGCTLNIIDSSAGQTGVFTGTGSSGSGRVIFNKGTINLRGGTLTMVAESTATISTGGVVHLNSGTFNMYGGAIVNGRADGASGVGGNVNILSGATFNMYGGTISGGTAAEGSNICVAKGGTLNHFDGTIADKDNTVLFKQ